MHHLELADPEFQTFILLTQNIGLKNRGILAESGQ